jgi:hypothetical protein
LNILFIDPRRLRFEDDLLVVLANVDISLGAKAAAGSTLPDGARRPKKLPPRNLSNK